MDTRTPEQIQEELARLCSPEMMGEFKECVEIRLQNRTVWLELYEAGGIVRTESTNMAVNRVVSAACQRCLWFVYRCQKDGVFYHEDMGPQFPTKLCDDQENGHLYEGMDALLATEDD